MTLASGGGATYDERTRIVCTKVRPVLKTADFLAATPVFVGGLRLFDGNYAGPLIKVRRVDTSATIDIYPTSSGAHDTAAIATFCGFAVGTNRHDLRPVWSGQERHHRGDDQGVPHLDRLHTIGTRGNPFAFIDAEDRGYTISIPTLTGTSLSAVLVGSLGNGVVNKMISLSGESAGCWTDEEI